MARLAATHLRWFAHGLAAAAIMMAIVTNGSGADSREAAVLAANAAFYRAFHDADIAAMDDVWGRDGDIVVVHPGWPELSGREIVLESWRRIFANPASPKIRFANAKVTFRDRSAVVTCDELLEDGTTRAMNIFRLERGTWKMVFHGAAVSESREL